MAGLQYSFFPTDFFYPRASPPATSLVAAATPNLKITQKRDDSVVVDKTSTSNFFFDQTLQYNLNRNRSQVISSSRWFSPVLASDMSFINGTADLSHAPLRRSKYHESPFSAGRRVRNSIRSCHRLYSCPFLPPWQPASLLLISSSSVGPHG
ncbi:hypothetical protein Bca52824_077539 [Brassica carinata]|uniref:Uncharacterized protein n=1 Tax=Brassica carinata TaxID=52824 RepID=A0A8X7PV50_BRACI|nr:hypothetical protein Bca52824_077539 [Brassica carinata]